MSTKVLLALFCLVTTGSAALAGPLPSQTRAYIKAQANTAKKLSMRSPVVQAFSATRYARFHRVTLWKSDPALGLGYGATAYVAKQPIAGIPARTAIIAQEDLHGLSYRALKLRGDLPLATARRP